MSSTRERGRIALVLKDAEHGCWWIRFDGEHGTQSFGGFALKDDSPEDKAFRSELAALFGVRWIHDAKGRNCFALRCFDINNEPIEGFEVDGKRWVLTDFRRRFWPNETWSRLEYRKSACLSAIASARQRIEHEESLHERLDGMFVDWSSPSVGTEQPL